MIQVLVFISALTMSVYALSILFVVKHLPRKKPGAAQGGLPGISIIIPCRNEALHIRSCLQSIEENLPFPCACEILVVDDHSEDRTAELAASMQERLPLRVLTSDGTGKKPALETGIAHAKHDVVLTLDADCRVGKMWLQTMANEFSARNLNMLCGPLALETGETLFTGMQRTESAAVVGISAALLESGRPATCNGANLMFSKSVFKTLGGYSGHRHLASGDDDLLMHRFFKYNPKATAYSLDANALVTTVAIAGKEEFYAQRLRWISKRGAYLYPWNGYLQVLVTLHLAAYYMLLLTALLFFMPGNLFYIVLKYAVDLIYRHKLKDFVQVPYVHVLLMPFYQSYVFVLLLKSRNHIPQWKGRKLR